MREMRKRPGYEERENKTEGKEEEEIRDFPCLTHRKFNIVWTVGKTHS